MEYLWKYLKKQGAVKGQDPKVDAISPAVLVGVAENIFLLHTDKDQLTFYLKVTRYSPIPGYYSYYSVSRPELILYSPDVCL